MTHLHDPRRGRGAQGNATSTRFNLPLHEMDGDWRDERGAIDGPEAPRRTTVTIEHPRTILARNTSPDVPFDRSINPYRGCEHGCIYCFARPSHAFHDLSPGLDFETRLFAKPIAADLLRETLSKKSYRPAPIAFGTNTDPWQPIEREWRITRACLEVLEACRHPLTITTKSDRLIRDLDILARMASLGLVAVAISITTLDPVTHRTLEPRAPAPPKRLAAIRALASAGVPVSVAVAPVIPAITDHEIEAILSAAAAAGARGAIYIPLRLPNEVAPLFRQWLEVYHPDRAAKVMAQVRSLRGGRDNDPRFGSRMRGEGPWAMLIRTRFHITCTRLSLNRDQHTLRCDLFRPPPGPQLAFNL